MSVVKQVKVDNWGIYFLQRLKHFFNRTDYCDLTLQFQDNAQLKVHRLVLSACTEYFELLERTCEMYEECLVMPDDLQADVVVPIINFMYTGHLEFRMDLLERLYQTSQILNMPVLSKLLEAHRQPVKFPVHSYSAVKKFSKVGEPSKISKPITHTKRSYSKAFDSNNVAFKDNKKVYQPLKTCDNNSSSSITCRSSSPPGLESTITYKKSKLVDPRPTRYELPEELDTDNVFDNSFCNISYACKPLMIHPETMKRYSSKRTGIFSDASTSKKILPSTSSVDIVECKRISRDEDENIFDDGNPNNSLNEDLAIFQTYNEPTQNSSQLFDQILSDGPKVTIETRDSKVASNLDHAKIISEVLKKYPHLVTSNKNIKLKILNTPSKGKKRKKMSPVYVEEKPLKLKTEEPDYTYETDVLNSQQAAKLIAMGAANTKGPWICLICGTPGKALHFTSYYKFRRHLVDVHNEKPVSNICEYCGFRSLKRNYLLHHLYSQHNVPPPPQYHFPKCDRCNYIALTEGFLVKHKLTHQKAKNFCCNVCSTPFTTTKGLLQHIQATGHKYSAEKKTNLQCIYCLRTFLRHGNFYAHLKTHHKKEAKNDGIIDDSDEEKDTEEVPRMKVDNRDGKYHHIKFEPSTSYDIYNENIYEEVDVQYQIQEGHDGDIHITPKKQVHVISHQQHNSTPSTPKQKILNPGFDNPKTTLKPSKTQVDRSSFLEEINIQPPPVTNNVNDEEIVLIDNTEYIMRENQLIPRRPKSGGNEYIISDIIDPASLQTVQPTTSMEYSSVHNTNILQDTQSTMVMKKASNINQPIQIVVSNEEEYKALMSSNHPILFNNDNPNKSLTVLTAPHSAGMESAAIDLNNTQSNDMMIIQENFPLNVTEAVPTDNPNIVVVYSHPVDDQNKQFQILTTGGIGSQFVQSSAIITQNYETVTTTAPVMSAHVLEPQPDSTWQDNIQSRNGEELPICPQSELQNVVQNVEIKPEQNENTDSLSELPEVHLGPGLETIVTQENLPNDTTNELSAMNTAHINEVGQEIAEVSHNIPAPQIESVIMGADNGVIIEQEHATAIIEPMDISHGNEHEHATAIIEPMDISHSNEHEHATATIEPINIPHDNEHVPEVVGNDDTANKDTVVQGPIGNDSIPEQTDMEETSEVTELPSRVEQAAMTIPDNSDTVDTIAVTEVPEMAENYLKSTLESEEPPQSQAYDDIVVLNHNIEEDHSSSKPEDKIQNLTSEWSENEYDVAEDAPATLEPIPRTEEVILRPPEPEVLEETIENIQQEILNHVSSTATLGATMEPVSEMVNENTALQKAESSPEVSQMLAETLATVSPIPSDPKAQQKISTLLNDWEDNDSQEDDDSQEENNSEGPIAINQEVNDTSTPTISKPDIKSLVSDWDDEEEDNREQ